MADGALDSANTPFADEDLWHGVEEGAREDWNSFSYFVVRECNPQRYDHCLSHRIGPPRNASPNFNAPLCLRLDLFVMQSPKQSVRSVRSNNPL